ncbi:2-hydroxyacyl-CoA dehydratase family protein [Ruminococcus sp.]|uniref:2-hydroxyacyl-CoA dehydratase family protein n=1 Tax=Ruminococcus sp. TaxID=41978 RepID=UPI0025CE1829|nr:2-hydroxyacyl-CoA dehydratase family protein [Ruminococcus sp.]
MGSPVVFPNYKIPFLVNDVGLTLLDSIDCSVLKHDLLHERNSFKGSCETMIRNIASAWYDRDASSVFVRNNALFGYISNLVQKRDIEGVVYHVLKGQIEYDFELERFETLFSKYNIPVFRLETDYQYQDVEQLRIRLEAFSEMLAQNRYKEVRRVK